MTGKPFGFLARLTSRLLTPRVGEVRALQQALHTKGLVQLGILFVVMVVVPSLLLGYFGILSTRAAELGVMTEVNAQGQAVADSFLRLVRHDFQVTESAILRRLEAGHNPLESPRRLHRHMLAALRLDADGEVQAPFRAEPRDSTEDVGLLFESAELQARLAERTEEAPLLIAQRYAVAAEKARGRAAQGRAAFDRGRMLVRAGELSQAIDVFDTVIVQFGTVRDPWGFRLGDLARLEEGRAVLSVDRAAGLEILRALVRDLVAARWDLGNGCEAAVAREALSLMGDEGDPDWLSQTRERVGERSALLYWSGELLPELHGLLGQTPPVIATGDTILWTQGKDALWATVRWNRDLYAFAIDVNALVSELKADARAATPPESRVIAYIGPTDEPEVGDAIVRRSLGPWLPGWVLTVSARDPDGLDRERITRRDERIGIVIVAMTLLVVGTILTGRLVSRELEIASMKSDFAANVSHELRSPITQIRIKGEALLFGLADTPAEQEQHYRAIVRESERLTRLVDNVLDFAAIERGRKEYNLRPGDIRKSILRALEGIQSSFELQGRMLEVDFPDALPLVSHDPDAVAQCIVNLVSNAAKYSDKGGTITVRGRRTREWVEIDVDDQGIGIAPSDLGHVFDAFFRSADSQARQRKGTGIGLTIVKRIMEAHHGDITVSSRPGIGSTFTLRFPFELIAED